MTTWRVWLAGVAAASLALSTPAGEALPPRLANAVRDAAGLCALPRGGDGTLALAVARASRLIVHTQDDRAALTAAARQAADAAGLLGRRVYAENGPAQRIPFADNTLNFVAVTDADPALLGQLTAAEVDRALCPGGHAIIGRATGAAGGLTRGTLEQWLGAKRAAVSEDASGLWAEWTKPMPAGIDDWSHWFHGPDNNPVSKDTVLRWPFATQWMGLPFHTPQPNNTLVAGGRVFLFIGHGWMGYNTNDQELRAMRNRLVVRDAYNGETHWERPLPSNFLAHRSCAVATPEVLYLAGDEDGVLCLDARSGVERSRIAPEGARGQVKWMALAGRRLFMLAGDKDPSLDDQTSRYGSIGPKDAEMGWGFGTRLAACDLDTGKTVWTREAASPVDARAIGLDGDRLYYYAPRAGLVCLSTDGGEERWANRTADTVKLVDEPDAAPDNLMINRSSTGMLCLPGAVTLHLPGRRTLGAFAAEDGRLLWKVEPGGAKRWGRVHLLAIDRTLYTNIQGAMLDVLTGEKQGQFGFGGSVCGRMTASPDGIYGQKGRGFDLVNKRPFPGEGLKTGCYDATIPADGLLFGSPHSCLCPVSFRGMVAFGPADAAAPTDDTPRLTAYPPRGAVADLAVTPQDWPAYRGNVSHSAYSTVPTPPTAQPLWTAAGSGDLATAPVAAGGLVFAGRESGAVEAFDAATGARRWRFLAGGPVTVPPAIGGGRAYVACGDGSVYALEANSGRLLWTFRASPAPRRVMLYGRLTDTWPVGGILFHEGTVYAAAGFNSMDGTHVYALDAATGAERWRNREAGHLDPATRLGAVPGDMTVAAGCLWMAGGGYTGAIGFDLKDGRLVPADFDGGVSKNQGTSIGLFPGGYLCVGGPFMARHAWERKGEGKSGVSFTRTEAQAKALYPVVQAVSGSFIMPAWDDKLFVVPVDNAAAVGFWDAKQTGVMLDAVARTNWVAQPWRRPKTEVWLRTHSPAFLEKPVPPWTWGPEKREVAGVALTPNAALVLWQDPKVKGAPATAGEPAWRLAALDRAKGSPLWEVTVPAPPLPGALCVDRRGRIIVALRDGGLICIGQN